MNLSHLQNSLDLTEAEIFRELSSQDLKMVLQHAGVQKVSANDFLFYEQDPAKTFYIVIKGLIKLTQITPAGDQVILRYVSPGEAFGVIAVLSAINYPVAAQAVEKSEVLAWDEPSMRRLMHAQPQIALNGIRILAKRVREFQHRIQELATEKMERRIARALLRLAQQSGKKEADGVHIDFRLTRQDLAELTGTTMFSVSRTLNHWQAQELILCEREKIIILSPHGLVRIAEDLDK